MTPRRARALFLALLGALAPAAGRAQADDAVRLKLERQMRLAPARPERDSAKFLEADRIQGTQDKSVIATGNVVLRQFGATIRADRVEYTDDDQMAVATGNVRLDRSGDTATGPSLRYDLSEDTGEMESPVFVFPKTPERRIATRGSASAVLLEADNKNRMRDAEYTSCPVPRKDWFLSVRELEIDSAANEGRAYNATVHFLGLPILYTPYMTFALDNKRRSGFLSPTFGTSGKSGFEAALPYYWLIADNLDATITPKVFTKRGAQLGGEFRYLEPKFTGILEGEVLPNDHIAERDRYFMSWRHNQDLGSGWHVALNGQKVSDDNYFRDLSTKIAATSQTNLPRDAIVGFDNDNWSVYARALAYQTLQDPNLGVPIVTPYRILPRVGATGFRQNVNGFDWTFFGEYSNFTHPQLVNGQRAIVYPSISYPVRRPWGYITPKVGYHVTRYAIGENGAGYDNATRSVPVSSVDAGLFFDRDFRWGDRAFQQTLEPRLYYLNVPFRDQTRLPNFATAESDFNFSQLFSENRFVGGDRIGDANQLTVALTTRFIESATGLERLSAGLGQVQYFREPRVTLGSTLQSAKSSDIVAFASTQLTPAVSADSTFQYTPSLSRSQKLTVAAHYMPVPGSVINAAYRYARGEITPLDPLQPQGIRQIDLSSQWPITQHINALARYNFSLLDHKSLEGLVGIEYNADCWQVRAVAHRFITSATTYSTSFQIQLELTGLSRIGINPFETIRQNISGYRRSDELTQ